MDYIRTAYYTKMRLHPEDPDRLTDVVWYRAEPDAKLFPESHRFGSLNWEERAQEGPLGEVVERGDYYTGWNWLGLTGQKFCGTIQQYQRGVLPGEAGCTLEDCGNRIEFDDVHSVNWVELLEPPVGVVEVLAPAPIAGTCSHYPEVAENYQLGVSGLTNTICPDCTNLNGAFILNYLGSCTWRTGQITFTCGGTFVWARWQLSSADDQGLSPPGMWLSVFLFPGGNAAFYYLPYEDFDPFGVNVFNLDSVNIAACNWPATVRVDARV